MSNSRASTALLMAATAVADRLGPAVSDRVQRYLNDILNRTVALQDDGTAFVITGDIPAMWLRDSTLQLTPFLHFLAADPGLADTVAAVSRRQLAYICRDPYANAFNATPDGAGHADLTERSAWVWERKYEVDSLAYPLQLAWDLWSATGRTDHLGQFADAAAAVLTVMEAEQDHAARSPYRFQRLTGPASDTLAEAGRGTPVAPTGLTWSGFRPSDDACRYGYNIPGNALAVMALGYLADLADALGTDGALASRATELARTIEQGMAAYAVVTAPTGEPMYAYEVDGLGHAFLADDANQPSLLGLPLTGWCAADDPTYLATRAYVLSPANLYFYSGAGAIGIGSPHTPAGHIWPIALAVQGLTATDPAEQAALLDRLAATDAGTGWMHESFHADDPTRYTRGWFAWANAMYAELALTVAGLSTHRRPVRAQVTP